MNGRGICAIVLVAGLLSLSAGTAWSGQQAEGKKKTTTEVKGKSGSKDGCCMGGMKEAKGSKEGCGSEKADRAAGAKHGKDAGCGDDQGMKEKTSTPETPETPEKK